MTFVTNGGVRIHYEVEGAGPPIIFHTGAGGDSRIWQMAGYLEPLAGFQKILIDQRGRGQSDHPKSVEAHRMENYVADVETVLDAVGVQRTVFFGYSNGVYVGSAFACAHPERARALVGLGGMAFMDVSDLGPLTDEKGVIARAIATGGVRADVETHEREGSAHFPDAINENVLASDPTMYALSRIARRGWHGPKSLYPSLRCPALLLAGEKEDPDRDTERAASAMPQGRAVLIPGIGHLEIFYRSDITLPHVLRFLEGLPV